VRDWRGPTGFALALCVGLGFLSAMVAVSFFQETAISSDGAALLNTLGGAIIGGVVVWLGGFGSQTDDATREHRTRGTTMSTTTPDEPRDPATNPDRDIEQQPQDVPDDDSQQSDQQQPER
jgi:hypothetical protein